MPMWMPGHCSGTTPILVRGPGGPCAAAAAAPAPQVEVYPTPYGDVVQVVVPPTVYETVQALGYHHLGDLYTGDHQVLPERALKGRAPARKGIAGLRTWLTRHAAVLAPLLRGPPPRRQPAPKDWIPDAVPTYQADVVIGGRAAKTTRMVTIYHRGQPLRVTAAMHDTMEAASWVPEHRVCQQPPKTLPSDTRLHRLLVALLGIQVQVNASLHAQLWGDHHQESLTRLQHAGVWAPTIVWMAAPPNCRLLAVGQDITGPSCDSHRGIAAVSVDSLSPGGRGEVPIPGGVCGAQVPRAPAQGAPLLLPRYGGSRAGGASPGPCAPISESTMGTWPSWRHTAGPPTPRKYSPLRLARASGSMTCLR